MLLVLAAVGALGYWLYSRSRIPTTGAPTRAAEPGETTGTNPWLAALAAATGAYARNA
jgi:hypothetical protein